MKQIDTAYDDYLAAAKELLIRLKSLGPQSATMHDYADVRKQSERLFDLGLSLERAHYYSRELLVAHANKTITELRVLVLASLSCIFAFGVALAWVVYRDMIAPLRVKLVESQALMERQEKLASLGMLAAGVAHEIRNPLTAIKAALFIQQKKFRAGTQEFDDAAAGRTRNPAARTDRERLPPVRAPARAGTGQRHRRPLCCRRVQSLFDHPNWPESQHSASD